jgi:hypothetical protein
MMRTTMARAALTLLLAGGLAACTENLTDVNTDPNAPTDVPPEFLLPQAIRSAVESAFGATMMLSHVGIWPGHFVQIQYPEEETGRVRPGTMDGYWSGFYAGPLKDAQTVIEKGRESGNPNHEGIGLIWRAWVFHIVTDLWGDVPFSESLQGAADATPLYDSQQEIYASLIEDLKTGAAMLDAGSAGFGAGDLLYGNDVAKWRRFANSLRMRLAMRLSEVDAATGRTEFADAYADGGFQSNADNAAISWPGAPYDNPIYENSLTRDDHGISGALVDTLLSLNDPRLALYAEPAAEDGEFRGHYNGYSDAPLSLAFYSRINDFWRADGAATPTLIMTYSEVLFLEAEAAQRGWINADAGDLYEAAIRANMNQWDVAAPADAPTDAEIDAYLASPRVAYDAANGLRQIQFQKWISLYMNALETFAEWRRTGVPELTPGPDLVTSRIPIRFHYPDAEQSYNSTNLQQAIGRQGGGLDLTTPVWWMPE